jgi:MFS family permease
MADPQRIDEKAPPLTFVQWLICATAAMGFAFDIFALLVLPLILRPALMELGGLKPGTPEFGTWAGRLFFVPAFAGGIFGLLGGYLTDRLGRRRILVWSILLYAFSAFASGFATTPMMLLILRCTTFIGVSVEFVAAVAWLAELFPHPKQREAVLGYTQAFSSLGGLMAAFANGLAVKWATGLPAISVPAWLHLGGHILDAHAGWRYTLIAGLLPAIPLIIIRPFLPESPAWRLKKLSGTMRRPSIVELFKPQLLRTTLVTTIIFACSYGAAFGAIQQIPQIVPGLPEVKAMEKGKPPKEQNAIEQKVASDVTKVQEFGGLAGRVLLAILAVYIVSRQKLLRIFQAPGLIVMPIVFGYFAVTSLNLLYVGIFFAGLFTVAQFSFWGNYLPRVYPVHLRGTGESFAANIGGRMIGTSFAWVTTNIAVKSWVPGGSVPAKMAYTAAAVGFGVYLIGLIMSFFLPEPAVQQVEE